MALDGNGDFVSSKLEKLGRPIASSSPTVRIAALNTLHEILQDDGQTRISNDKPS